jgi:hypothetical protein
MGVYGNQDVVVQGWPLQDTGGPHTRYSLTTRPRAVQVYIYVRPFSVSKRGGGDSGIELTIKPLFTNNKCARSTVQ